MRQGLREEAAPVLRMERMGHAFLRFKRECRPESFPEAFAAHVRRPDPSRPALSAYYWPAGGFHVVTEAALAKEVLISPAFSADRSTFFLSRMPNVDIRLLGDFFSIIQRMMVMSDGSVHRQRRALGGRGLNEHFIDALRAVVEAEVRQCLDRVADGAADLVQSVARPLPARVMAELFRIPKSERPHFHRCAGVMTAFFGGAVEYDNASAHAVNAAAREISACLRDLIAFERRKPTGGFVANMLDAQAELGLCTEALIAQAVMMLVAGQVTTTDQIANNLYLLLSRPWLYRKVVSRPELVPAATEECNRVDPAVTFLFRVATADVTLGRQPVAAGETVFISTHAVHRDPALVSQPDTVDPHRRPTRHIAFGQGAHFCLGAKLGRLQLTEVMRQIVARFPRLALEPNAAQRDHYSLAFSGFSCLPVQPGRGRRVPPSIAQMPLNKTA